MLICHILKKRGYRCTTDAEEPEEPVKEEEKNVEIGGKKSFKILYSENCLKYVHFVEWKTICSVFEKCLLFQ